MDEQVPSDPTGAAAADPPNPKEDAEALGRSLCSIVERHVAEHMQWAQGYHDWAQQMLMNMQQIPPQAHADYANRLQWITNLLRQYQEAADILKGNGDNTLADLLAGYSDGFTKLSKTRQETSEAMMRDDAATQNAMAGIANQIAADNLKAGAERMRIQGEAASFAQGEFAKAIAKQQESFGKMNEAVKKGLFGL